MAPSPPATPLFVPSAKGDSASRIASLHNKHHVWESFTARRGTAARMHVIPECCTLKLGLKICQLDILSFMSFMPGAQYM